MTDFTELRAQIQQVLSGRLRTLTERFQSLLSDTSELSGSPGKIRQELNRIYQSILSSNQELASEFERLLTVSEKTEKQIRQLQEEKRRLEVLYSSGITFSSETETSLLMEKAIDIVVAEMKADEGFIVIKDQRSGKESIYSRNMDPTKAHEAKAMSSTVIQETMEQLKPTKMSDMNARRTLAKQSSILRLGITAVLCVPLIHRDRVLGAVYLDRRNKGNPFSENDLAFLLSFARQIVQGFETSQKFSLLERKLFEDVTLDFNKLREEFECDEIIGQSQTLLDVLKFASKIAPSDASIFILGESGTGKDLIARTIHNNSPRKNKPFITIDCGSIPSDLLESELFGHERGAFTGATNKKPGKLESAKGGTIFFNEIAEMPVPLQAKLLRVIQTREFERLGGVETHVIDARFIAATNKDIEKAILNQEFREDLYYRLKVFELRMPSLHERKEDIPMLVESFLERYSTEDRPVSITDEAMHCLKEYPWPGNIRELMNVVHRCTVLAQNGVIGVKDLPPEQMENLQPELVIQDDATLHEAEQVFRRQYILQVLEKTDSKTEAAKALGINRTHFYRLLSQLNIDY